MMNMNTMMNGMMAYGWLGLLLGAALLVLLIVGIVGLVSSRNYDGSDDPLDSAKRRYARGEIDQEEFDKIKRTLN